MYQWNILLLGSFHSCAMRSVPLLLFYATVVINNSPNLSKLFHDSEFKHENALRVSEQNAVN